MTEHKLSKETRLLIQEDGNVLLMKKLPIGPKGKMLEFSVPLTIDEWDNLQSLIFNQDAHSPQCAECMNTVYSCVCRAEEVRKRKKVVVSDALLWEESDPVSEEPDAKPKVGFSSETGRKAALKARSNSYEKRKAKGELPSQKLAATNDDEWNEGWTQFLRDQEMSHW